MTSGLDDLWRLYKAEYPTWKMVGERVASGLRAAVTPKGILCSITSRPKEVDSLLRKALIKQRVDRIEDVRDKAGVRVMAYFPDEVSALKEIIHQTCDVRKEENKIGALGADRFGYLGIHFDVVLSSGDLPGGLPRVRGELWCEVQLHTFSQTLFASVSHPLLYKTPSNPEPEVVRAINTVSVLGEVIDRELTHARQAVMNQTGYPEARLMMNLERHFLALSGCEGDPEITQRIVDALAPLLQNETPDSFEARLRMFVEDRSEELRWLYERNRQAPADALIMQPASLLIFERLVADPYSLKDQWVASGLPEVALERVAATLGHPIVS